MPDSELFNSHKQLLNIYKDLLINFNLASNLSKDKTEVEQNLDNLVIILTHFIKSLEEDDIASFEMLEPLISHYISRAK